MNVLILVGEAGSGKDTAADALVRRFGAEKIAQAAPLKEFARGVFDFNDLQLYGPSEYRNAVDPRYTDPESAHWQIAQRAVSGDLGRLWVETVGGMEDADENHRALVMWFADLLQLATRAGGLSPRLVLQTLGTEYGRAIFGDDVWILHALSKAATSTAPLAVIVDGRFNNEVIAVRELCGVALRLTAERRAEVRAHKSEDLASIPSELFNATVINHKTGVEKFEADVIATVHKLFPSL
jgi:hypothetical protein